MMGLFDKKECAICGKKVGLLGARKVEDGTICSDCNKKLSPLFSERKRSTVADIQQQLAYREQNKQNINFFNPTRVYGHGTKIYIDDNQRKFCVSRKSDYRAENADLIDFTQVTNANYRIDEDKTERFMTDSQGNERPYSPPQYDCSYEFEVYIGVNSPYFSEIKFDLTDSFGRPDSRYTDEYRRLEQMANEIVQTFGGGAAMGGAMGAAMGMGAMNGQMQGGYTQMNNGYQQPMQGGYQQQQPMQGGYAQQQPMQGGYAQQQPMQGGYQQQQPMQGGYAQQQPLQGGYQQQPVQGGYQQPTQGGYAQQPVQPQAPAQWTCPNCGSMNTTNFCQNCGTPKQ
jgi:hypothetical protein